MDLGVYIGELLGLQGKVSVPGIGHFAQVRINGYFNEAENKFYPPTHEISFDPVSKDDEELAKYISEKKNISLASSKYFIEKYVVGIRQQVALKKVEIDGVGYLSSNGSELTFTAHDHFVANDPSFYGFQPVDIPEPDKNQVVEEPIKEEAPIQEEALAKEEPIQEEAPIVNEEPKAEEVVEPTVPTIIPRDPEEEAPTEEYAYDEPAREGKSNVWIGLLLILIIALLTLMGLYKYRPEWFDKKNPQHTIIVVKVDSSKIAADSIAKAAKDSAAARTTPANNTPVDTLRTLHYEILGGAFKTLSQADGIIKKYQKLGLQPRLLKHAAGNYYKVTLGTYFSNEDAQRAVDSIVSATKIDKTNIYLQPILPKK
jgi:septal ring-binding cell division protein DamX